jgi:hypothetical protein
LATTVVVKLTTAQYTWLEGIASANRHAEETWLVEERERLLIPDGEPLPLAVWLHLAEIRPQRWPRQVHLVNDAIRARLALADLAGPWEPWSAEERARHKVAGRRIGTPHQHFDMKCSYDLDTPAVDAARLAADRYSAPYIAALKAERLIGRSARRGRGAALRRAELQDHVYTLGRIIRQGINMLIEQ